MKKKREMFGILRRITGNKLAIAYKSLFFELAIYVLSLGYTISM